MNRNRHSIRLPEYNYSSPGLYFVTLCLNDISQNPLGEIKDGKMITNEVAQIIAKHWLEIPQVFNGVLLDSWIIMPNHFHGILRIVDTGEAEQGNSLPNRRNMLLPRVIGRFKMVTAKEVNILQNSQGRKFWHRNYWEHVIRNEQDYNRINEYIQTNPIRWEIDRFNQSRTQ